MELCTYLPSLHSYLSISWFISLHLVEFGVSRSFTTFVLKHKLEQVNFELKVDILLLSQLVNLLAIVMIFEESKKNGKRG